MAQHLPHISVCVCTFRRSELLRLLLHNLGGQQTGGLFTYSIVIADNDFAQSSQKVVLEFQSASSLDIGYCVEPEQNIALARNQALANAKGDYVAFIDDDELPVSDWLLKLLQTCQTHKVDGVLGPVLPQFETNPPAWVTRGRFYERPTHATGFTIDWTEGRTGNLLLRRAMLDGIEPVFRPEFGSGGEDRNFFRRMIDAGRVFVWCNEAEVYERVPALRWKRSFMIRRALLRGKMALNHQRGLANLTKSFLAVMGYTLALPIFFVLGQHLFMKYLIKTCDHAGMIAAFAKVNLIREKYVTE
jgi:succinoglycan biosynthesis protein ExoM